MGVIGSVYFSLSYACFAIFTPNKIQAKHTNNSPFLKAPHFFRGAFSETAIIISAIEADTVRTVSAFLGATKKSFSPLLYKKTIFSD